MKLFQIDLEVQNTGQIAGIWKPHVLVMDYSNQHVKISYHGWSTLTGLQMGKERINGAGQEFTIKNWVETVENEDGTTTDIAHDDFSDFAANLDNSIVNTLDSAVDAALVEHIQNVSLNTVFKTATVI